MSMQELFTQALQFLEHGLADILNFARLVWTWAIGEMAAVVQAPWQDWPLWKQLLLALVAGVVILALYKVARDLWEVVERLLTAFVAFLGALVRTLPNVAIAGLVALAGVWLVNHVDLSNVHLPSFQALHTSTR
jgi:hypothetical protein